MKNYLANIILPLAFVSICAIVARANDNELKQVQTRAQRIVDALDESPNYGARTIPRSQWDRFAQLPSAQNVIKSAESLLKSPLPELPESLYKEYYQNGNRTRYQNAYGNLTRRVETLTLAEMFENKGRFLDALDEAILYLCKQPSWVLPAHDKNAEIYDGKTVYSDLGSTLAAGNLAIAINLFADKLPKETVELSKAEIEKRILAPYRDAVAAEKPAAGMDTHVKQLERGMSRGYGRVGSQYSRLARRTSVLSRGGGLFLRNLFHARLYRRRLLFGRYGILELRRRQLYVIRSVSARRHKRRTRSVPFR